MKIKLVPKASQTISEVCGQPNDSFHKVLDETRADLYKQQEAANSRIMKTINVSTDDLKSICEAVIESFRTYGDNYDYCAHCLVDTLNGEVKHNFDCPVLIAKNICPKD